LKFQRYIYIFNIALEAVMAYKFRSFLTTLGIIFGVAAVITMMAIGNGAKQEILEQIKLVGVNNIVIRPVTPGGDEQDSSDEDGKSMQNKYSPGLTLKDAESIKDIIPTVTRVSPEVTYETFIIKSGKRRTAKLNGVTPDFFEVYNLQLQEGRFFTEEQMINARPVCVIGPTIKAKLFPEENPIGKYIKCGHVWLKVIGILEINMFNVATDRDLGVSDYNNNIYAPIQTVLLRYKDRSVINSNSVHGGGSGIVIRGGFVTSFWSSSGSDESNFNQLDKIVVQVSESDYLLSSSNTIQKMMLRRHAEVDDFDISIPEILLKQEQRTKDIFNIVLAVIAGISLIVGGIGIMNIMLASVMERIKEIGIRMATGATKKDVVFQFLTEATLISISGGFIGIFMGFFFSKIIMQVTGILTIISPLSIIVSFCVSAAVGIAFGYVPAKRAASQDPVVSLRHE